MAYQIKKSNHIVEDLELLGDDGKVELTVHVDINTDRIAGGFRKVEIDLMNAQRNIKKGENSEALENYGKAVIEFFRLIFGEENTTVMLKHFEGQYTDMFIQLYPFINDVIKPAIESSAAAQKALIANNFNYTKKQKRKLGLK